MNVFMGVSCVHLSQKLPFLSRAFLLPLKPVSLQFPLVYFHTDVAQGWVSLNFATGLLARMRKAYLNDVRVGGWSKPIATHH